VVAGAVSGLAFACGAGFALGLLLLSHGLGRHATRPARFEPRRLSLAMLAGSAAGVLTGWPVGAVLVGALALAAPSLVGGKKVAEKAIARTEAVAAWTETLRDTLAATSGLQRAIMATAAVAPKPIATEVGALAAQLRTRQPLPQALRAFADDLGDATADLVVSTLVLAYERRATNLSGLLGALAASAREEAAMQRRVLADRASVRAAVSVVTIFTLGAFAVLVVFNRGFLRPYDTALGQVVLALDGAMFAGGFWVLHQLGRLPTTERVLTAAPAPLVAADAGGGR
jgi:Flp pilus assembly protein TadB